MSQAFNLSQFANKVNLSGQADLTTAVTGTLPQGNGGTGLTTPGTSGNVLMSDGTNWVSGTIYPMRNRIINGAMVIDQRNAGASITPSSDTYTVDRWKYESSIASKFTIQQNKGSITPPAGFSNYLGFTTASAVSVGSGDYFLCEQYIEGFNCADLGWGTANAKTVTLSFLVYSSLTGTFGANLQNGANGRYYPFGYTISSANTWTQISITIPGDTSGTWATGNTAGILLRFNLGAGSTYLGTPNVWGSTVYVGVTGQTNVVGTLNANWYVTGVQLEQGSTATPFERRLYNQELANCQRYYYRFGGDATYQMFGSGVASSTTNVYVGLVNPVPMRAAPTTLDYSALSNLEVFNSAHYVITGIGFDMPATNITAIFVTASGLTQNGAYRLIAANTTSARLGIGAEL